VKDQGSSMPCALSQRYALMGATVLALLCLLVLFGTAGRAQAYSGVGDFVRGQVVVKLKPTGATIENINTSYGSTTLERFPGSTEIYLLKLQAGSDLLGVVENMTADPRLLFAEPNFLSQAPEGDGRHKAWGVSASGPSPTDYAPKALGLSEAHAISRGSGTTVAVLDTGAQLDHPALKANFEGVKRYDFVDSDTNPSDRQVGRDADGDGYKDEMVGHGTHVAGIVDLSAPGAKIMPLRVLDTEGYGDVFAIAKAVSYAERNAADVINLSLGTPSRSRLLREAIDDAADKGVVTAAAAGNSNITVPHYPAAGTGVVAAVDGLLAVTSVDAYEKKSHFANYGVWVDIAAPGEGIRSAFPVSVYASWSGTSMATPFIAGQAALVHAVDGSLGPAGVERRIRCSARPLALKNPTYVGMLGAGHADVRASLDPGACR
jgi:thermitase